MFQALHNFFYPSISLQGCNVAFIILSSLSIASIILAIMLSVFVKGFGILKRSFHFIIIIAVYVISKSILFNYLQFSGVADLMLSINLILSLPLLLIRVKKDKTEEQDLNEFIDHTIKTQSFSDGITISKNLPKPEQVLTCRQRLNEKSAPDVDYSHVYGILERLNYYPLSNADKSKMRELEANLIEAQKGEGDSVNSRSKVNEGLGELLKIMSRYGV